MDESFDIIAKIGSAVTTQLEVVDGKVEAVHGKVEVVDGKVDAVHEEVKVVDDKVEAVHSEVEKLSSRMDKMSGNLSNLSGNALWFSSMEGKQIAPILPLLFNGESGICGWVPVNFSDSAGIGHSVVVVAVSMIQYIFSQLPYKGHLAAAVGNFLRANLVRFRGGARPSYDDFVEIIMRTPFKCYALGNRGKHFAFRQNDDNYIITEGTYWSDLMKEISDFFPEADTSLSLKNFTFPVGSMGQCWSLMATSKDDDRTPVIDNLRHTRLNFGERMRMPACGVPWWREAYESGAAQYFGMNIVDGVDLKHVIDGKISNTGLVVETFAKTLEKFEEFGDNPRKSRKLWKCGKTNNKRKSEVAKLASSLKTSTKKKKKRRTEVDKLKPFGAIV